MEFRLSRSLSQIFLSHDGFLAITKPSHELFFFMMESWLSRSLLMKFSFSRWNPGYHEAFSSTFIFHDGILAITKPSHELFFFTMESWLSRSLFTNHSGILAVKEPFHEFLFHTMEFRLSRSLFTNFSFTRWNSQNA
jgi:hypothetical protein